MVTFNIADVSLRAESRLTERSQTTIPASIGDALHLKPGENIPCCPVGR
jgi:antitoxin PrlF